MVVHVADDLAPAAVRAELLARGIAVKAEERAGRLLITTARELLLPGGRFDAGAARARIATLGAVARAAGLARVRLCTEMTYLLSGAPGLEATLELQARLDEDVGAGLPLVRLSAFNTAREVTDLVADVLRVHPILISHGLPLANPYYRPWSELRTGHQPWPARAG
jgi:hypothetical protein